VLHRFPHLHEQVAGRILAVDKDVDAMTAVERPGDGQGPLQCIGHLVDDIGLEPKLKKRGNGHGGFLLQ
jgi:hypothetical protein